MTGAVHWKNKRKIEAFMEELDDIEDRLLSRSARVYLQKAQENLSYAAEAEQFAARGGNHR